MSAAADALRADYLQLSRVLARLSDAAHAGDLDALTAAQAAHDTIMARIQGSTVALADLDDAETLARTIRASLQDIKAAAPRIKAMQDKFAGDASEARLHRQVSQSYR